MNSKRFFIVMIVLVGLLLLGFGGGTYKANSMLHDESEKLVELKLTSSVLEKQREGLNQAKRDIAEFSELEKLTKSILPQEKDQVNTIGEIATHAQTANIRLGAIEFPQSQLGQVSRGRRAAAATDSSKTQLTPLEDLKGVYVMDIDIRNHGEHPVDYEQIIRFLELLEGNRRTAQVVNISIQPDAENKTLFHFTINLNTYVRP